MSQGAVGKEWVGVMAKPVVFFGALFGPAPWCPLGSGSLSAPVGSNFSVLSWFWFLGCLCGFRSFWRSVGSVLWVFGGFRFLVRLLASLVTVLQKKPCSVSRGRPVTPWLSRVLRPPSDTVFPVVAGQTPSLRTRWPSLAPPVCQKGFFCYRGAAGWPFAFELIKATWSQYSGSRTLARLVASASGRSHLLRHIS